MNSQNYLVGNTPIYTSRRVERVAVGRRDFLMSYGDRMFVRATIGVGERMEYETCSVSDMTDLIGDLRVRARGRRGLAVITIRNRDRGWVRESRVMLYPERGYVTPRKVQEARRQMMMPWDV